MEALEQKRKVKKGVILAGGLGTRFLPGTLVVAKELFPIMGKPVMLYMLDELSKAGITEVLIVGNKLKEQSIKSFISPPQEYLDKIVMDGKLANLAEYNGIMTRFKSISYVNQEKGSELFNKYNGGGSEVRGSSIAILAAKEWVNGEPFLVLNGDDVCYYADGKSASSELVSVFEQTGDNIVYGREVSRDKIYKYSSMEIGDPVAGGKGFKMKDIVEKPLPGTEKSNIMGFGRYLFNSEYFDKILTSKPRPNGEFCMTDVIQDMSKENKVSTCIFDGKYFDCGSYLGFQMAGNYFLAENEENRKALDSEMKELHKLYDGKEKKD